MGYVLSHGDEILKVRLMQQDGWNVVDIETLREGYFSSECLRYGKFTGRQ